MEGGWCKPRVPPKIAKIRLRIIRVWRINGVLIIRMVRLKSPYDPSLLVNVLGLTCHVSLVNVLRVTCHMTLVNVLGLTCHVTCERSATASHVTLVNVWLLLVVAQAFAFSTKVRALACAHAQMRQSQHTHIHTHSRTLTRTLTHSHTHTGVSCWTVQLWPFARMAANAAASWARMIGSSCRLWTF